MRALPLPLGEVPEAERVVFTLSVGFAASSPRVGAKGKRIVTGGNPRRIATSVRAQAPDDMRIWPRAGTDRQDVRQNWKRFSEVPKMGCRGLWKKRKIISCVKKGLIS